MTAKLQQVQNESGNDKQLMVLFNRHGVDQYVAMTVESAPGGSG